jgi:Collagen triple helix repeat (20 copies)
MLESIHARLGTAGFVLSVVALVVALGGGAYAASGGLTGKQKKEVEKIAKSVSKPGKTGATGPAGPAGAKGDAGAAGGNGAAGTNGTNGINGTNGTNGTTGFTSTLPSGKTETGTFAFNSPGPNPVRTAISFPIPLAAPLSGGAVHMLLADGSKELVINETTTEVEEVTPTDCGVALTPAGTSSKPSAAAGNLCVYLDKLEPEPINSGGVPPSLTGSQFLIDPSNTCESFGCLEEFGGPGGGAGVSGSRLEIAQTEPSYGYGTWAVTAP